MKKMSSLCKSVLPFSFKAPSRLLTPAEKKLAKRQSDNLKWQQDSFHRILNLVGLHDAGLASAASLTSARTQLLATLTGGDGQGDPPAVTRDKLLFLQDLLHAGCISERDYHAAARRLLRTLAADGAEEWSVIDLRDEDSVPAETPPSTPKFLAPIKQALSFVKENRSSIKRWRRAESDPPGSISKKTKVPIKP